VSWLAEIATADYKLRPDGGGARPSAGERLAATTAWALRFLPEMDQNCSVHRFFSNSARFRFRLCVPIRLVSYSATYSAFFLLHLNV
jgi:hypothetical protein